MPYISRSGLTSRTIRVVGNSIARTGKGNGRLCIINYHRVLEFSNPLLDSEPDVGTFRWQMELLAECFNVLPLSEAVEALRTEAMPPRAVAITFDDGYRSVHDIALPILRELSLPATVFLTSGYVGESNMWNDRIIQAVQEMPLDVLDLRDVGLGVHSLKSTTDRKITVERLTEGSKYLPQVERLGLTRKLEGLVGNPSAQGLMVTRPMIENLVRHGIDIGAHTVTHPILSRLDDGEAWQEMIIGKQQLESITGKPIQLFAYPNGKVGRDFDERHVQMARAAGFTAAFTTAAGAASCKHDVFQLPRSRPWDRTPFSFGLRLLRWLAR